ncbi:fructosamine kinase family protein [Mangrovibacterium diazotrophicum]|uniref:Fructosamine-3-kinase n=1 Tax=Mangrovibacterium diazotrophicum TaxID=1261403 RepID=A0A419W330_9BACT|nr:fructosamine kinase family protein [Mangrovibacterium diazotrophicum]RKD89868.1 fructosamine-3-kinase [Mangrovibacterium diazotrophicum]
MTESIINYLEEELVEMLGSGFQVQRREPVGGGCISHAFRLYTTKGTFFLKWNHSCADDLFVREAECLRELKKFAGGELIVPEVILASEADELSGFILLENLENGSVPSQDVKLGRGLAHLHRYQEKDFGFDHDNYCGATAQMNERKESWLEFFMENRLGFIIRLIQNSRNISAADLRTFESLIERLDRFISSDSRASLIHGDLWSGNYLYTAKGPAIIDPASYYADREMELSIMQMFGGFSPKTWAAYKEAFPLSSGWEDRVQIYQLYHILNHYYLFGGGYLQQAVNVARKYL